MPQADVRAAGLPAAAAALLVVAIYFGDGTSSPRLFWIGAGALLVLAAASVRRTVPMRGAAGAFVALLGALVLWQIATIAWSIEPSASWDYANRGLVYFAFGCIGVLLGSVPRAWVAAALGALTTSVLVVALAAKCVPALYDDYGRLARLRWPLQYWNELALLAAATVPLGLWLASRRDRPLRARAAGALHVYVALVAVVLTFSRFGTALAVVAAVVWVAFDRERLDSFAVLVVSVPPAVLVAGIALALPGIADDGTSHATRARDGAIFAALLVVGSLVTVVGGYVALAREADVPRRRRAARLTGVAVAAALVAALGVLVVRAGGPADFVRVRWHEFSATQGVNSVAHLGSSSSGNRWGWWQQSWDAFVRHPGGGTGAGSFALTSTIAAHNSQQATIEPHSTPLQFLTETGIVGFLLYVGVVAVVAVGVRRGPRDAATRALVFAAAIGLLHAVVDIDWSFVATQAPLFVVAGVLVSRQDRSRVVRRRALAVAATSIALLASLYSLFAPWYSNRRFNDALDAAAHLQLGSAQAAADDAHTLNPLALDPIELLASLDEATSRSAAERLFLEATTREPLNPNAWQELGLFYKRQGHWLDAYRALNRAYSLNRFGPGFGKGGVLDQTRCAKDAATCSPSLVGTVPIPAPYLRRLSAVASDAARRSGVSSSAAFAYVTTRGRFVATAHMAPPDDVIYAVVARARRRYLALAVLPRTFKPIAVRITATAPDTSRLGHANRLSLR